MEDFDKNKLSKLSPRERIKKLKQLGKERKKEFTEIETLIKNSMQELKTDEVASEITPKPRDVDIGSLFEVEGEKLEATVKSEAKEVSEEPLKYISFKQAYQDYKQLQNISYASMMGTVSEAQMETLDKIGEKLDRSKYVSVSDEAVNILVASKAAIHKIRKYAGLE